jgi:hypothetical protein
VFFLKGTELQCGGVSIALTSVPCRFDAPALTIADGAIASMSLLKYSKRDFPDGLNLCLKYLPGDALR